MTYQDAPPGAIGAPGPVAARRYAVLSLVTAAVVVVIKLVAYALTQLAAMQHETTAVDVDHAAAQLANLKALWADATEEERRTIVLGIVEAVWVDLDGNQVEAVQPKAWFYPLREAFPATWAFCGTDGIRPLITTTPCAYLGRRAA